jgi:ATP-dependent RNA helicase DDX5/DBP2
LFVQYQLTNRRYGGGQSNGYSNGGGYGGGGGGFGGDKMSNLGDGLKHQEWGILQTPLTSYRLLTFQI